MDKNEEKNIIQIIAALITTSLRKENQFPTGEALRKEVVEFATLRDYKKKKYSPSDISQLKEKALTPEYIDFSRVCVRGGVEQEIGRKLENAFGLEKAVVINNYDIIVSDRTINDYLGSKAAEYLQQDFQGKPASRIPSLLNEKARKYFFNELSSKTDTTKKAQQDRKILTFSCGSSVSAAINSLDGDFSNTIIYSSIILFADAFEGLSPTQLVHNFGNKFKGSMCVASQIPHRVLGQLGEGTQNDFDTRRSIYRSIIGPSLEKTLDSDYLMLGVGGIPSDRKFGGFSLHVEQKKSTDQEKKLWSALSQRCCGEISHWPILKNGALAEEGDYSKDTIWLWDYLWTKQERYAEMYKEEYNPLESTPLYEKECGLFIEYFIKTYTINFNRLMVLKSLQHEIIGEINRLADQYPEKELPAKLRKLVCEDKYQHILGIDQSTIEEPTPLHIIDKLNKRKVITPAGGVGKAEALYQCLKKKNIIDILVTDGDTASEIINIIENSMT